VGTLQVTGGILELGASAQLDVSFGTSLDFGEVVIDAGRSSVVRFLNPLQDNHSFTLPSTTGVITFADVIVTENVTLQLEGDYVVDNLTVAAGAFVITSAQGSMVATSCAIHPSAGVSFGICP